MHWLTIHDWVKKVWRFQTKARAKVLKAWKSKKFLKIKCLKVSKVSKGLEKLKGSKKVSKRIKFFQQKNKVVSKE